MVDVTLVEVFVALGTFTLAGATFWLGWESRKDRKSRDAKELAAGIYNPLRGEVLNWADTESVYRFASRDVWVALKKNQLHLVARIPKSMNSLLDATEKDVGIVSFRRLKVNGKFAQEMQKVAVELYPQAQAGSFVIIRLMIARMNVRQIDPDLVWLSRKSLKDYVNDFVTKHFPNDTWNLELYVGNALCGGIREAESYTARISSFLDGDKEANELRDLAYKIRSAGESINSLIEKELKKH